MVPGGLVECVPGMISNTNPHQHPGSGCGWVMGLWLGPVPGVRSLYLSVCGRVGQSLTGMGEGMTLPRVKGWNVAVALAKGQSVAESEGNL